jgi:cation diffusion facilitator family transporter
MGVGADDHAGSGGHAEPRDSSPGALEAGADAGSGHGGGAGHTAGADQGHDHGDSDDHGHGTSHDDGHDSDRGHGTSHDDGHDRGRGHAHDDDPDPDPGHGHGHGHPTGLRGFLAGVVRPHSHDHADSFDQELLASRAGTRALWISLSGLLATAAVQAVIVASSHSVGLLADAIHNAADALTALPIGMAFVIGRRPPTRRYTYGFGRAEDLAGLSVVAVIAFSVVTAVWESVLRLVHPHHVDHLWAVAVAGLLGFAGNELAARYRITVGRRIGSAALVADGRHARADGFTSLAVVAGAGGVAAGWRLADPVVGLAISVAIAAVLWGAGRDVVRRLMDATEPETVEQIRGHALDVEGVAGADHIRVRWLGHALHATLDLTVPGTLPLAQAHEIAETVQHRLFHEVPRLTDVTIHINPDHEPGADPHALTAHHRRE